ncbi:MAG: hypothetical protein JF588_01315 [Caulobacterales bacterium]|nr:hypothetical protein [Caulobacterales bacterium]
MLPVSMRTFPGLFVGRRTLVDAGASGGADEHALRFVCGACDETIFSAEDRSFLADLVIKCRCGEFNQL